MDVTLEQILNFVLIHNETIIQWLVIVVLALSLGVVAISIFGRHPGTDDERARGVGAGGGHHSGMIGANGLSASGINSGAPGIIPAEAAAAVAQVTHLQAELTQRTQELIQIKTDLEKTKGENVDISDYLRKIKDLEGKLSEYEILEDDIADLSLYKDENFKLKAEVQRLSTGVPLGAAASSSSAPVPAAVPVPPVRETSEQGEEDDLVEQFASAVEQSKPPAPQAAQTLAPPKAAAPAADVEGDDLLTEFAASIGETLSDDMENEASGDLDTDKMLAEMADLDGEASDPTDLDEEADIDKMAAEATKLLGTE